MAAYATPVDLHTLARDMRCSVNDVRSRIVRALQMGGVLPMHLTHVTDGDITKRIVVSVEVDRKGAATYYVQDQYTGIWRQL